MPNLQLKNNKKIILLIIPLIILVAIVATSDNYDISTSAKRGIKTSNIEKYYDKPIISILSISRSGVNIEAGYYRYGDIDKNGEIDEYDSTGLEQYINKQVQFDSTSKILGDINQDKKIDEKDLNELNSYLEKTKKTKYSIDNKKIEYCVATEKDSSKCTWSKSSNQNITKNGKYYIYVRDSETKKVSKVYKYKHKKRNYNESI